MCQSKAETVFLHNVCALCNLVTHVMQFFEILTSVFFKIANEKKVKMRTRKSRNAPRSLQKFQ